MNRVLAKGSEGKLGFRSEEHRDERACADAGQEVDQFIAGAEEKLRLEGAMRDWSPGFETHRDWITVEQSQAMVTHRALGAPVMWLTTIARNDTGRTVIVFESQGFPVRGRMAVIIQTQQVALEPNEVIKARILLEDIKLEVERAKIRVEVTGVLFD